MRMRTAAEEAAIRLDVFRWLDEMFVGHGGYELSRDQLLSYRYRGEPIPLLDRTRGIRNPRDFSATLSVMTSAGKNPYEDDESDDGWITYDYRAGEGGDNVKLIRAYELQTPIVYFKGVRPGYYLPYYPITIAANDPVARQVRFPLDEALVLFGEPSTYNELQRQYAERVVQARLHQPVFRAHVLHAYEGSCTVCDLKHTEFLDAAHIIPDASADGVAHVTNGLALCKIHHAAYDRNLMGITPDYEVRINHDLLHEVDGPMLRHGLQDMHGRRIRLPTHRSERPAQDRLAERFAEFTQ